MRKSSLLIVCLFACMLSGCSSAQTLQDQYDKGYDDGYSEGQAAALHDLSVDDLPEDITRSLVAAWIQDNQSEFIDQYSPYFMDTIGVEQYNEGYKNACTDHGIPYEE